MLRIGRSVPTSSGGNSQTAEARTALGSRPGGRSYNRTAEPRNGGTAERFSRVASLLLTLTLLIAPSAHAATFNSGSTGADGPFNPPGTVPPGTTVVGNIVSIPLPPSGVFNFTTITIPAVVTVQFTRNAGNTPVTLLASGDVTIAGMISLDGQPGNPGMTGTSFIPNPGGAGGPGGFDGGAGGGNGLGPGGGGAGACGGGGFGTLGIVGGGCPGGGAVYGNAELLPLLGGSGGGGGASGVGLTGGSGGGGGGALLIAASGTLTLAGTITARGGDGGATAPGQPGHEGRGGAGGGVRLVATTLAGVGGTIDVRGGLVSGFSNGGGGRIRVEAYTNTATPNVPRSNFFFPIPFSTGVPGVTVPTGLPGLRIASMAGVAAPAAPTGALATPDVTLPVTTTSPVTVVVSAAGIPDGTPVVLLGTPQTGPVVTATTPGLVGGTVSAPLALDLIQPNVITAEATFVVAAVDVPVRVALVAGPDPVTHVRVAATFGGESDMIYVTRSGRQIPAN